VWRALPPIALGHATSVGAVLLLGWLAQMVVPIALTKVIVAFLLMAFGVYRLWRHRHPRFGGMQVGFRDLTVWSFLMASAHGAGLMVLPFVMVMSDHALAAQVRHGHHGAASSHVPWIGATALGLHTVAYLFVLALVAWIVYRKLGLALLRTAWFNLDWLWAAALVAAGAGVILS